MSAPVEICSFEHVLAQKASRVACWALKTEAWIAPKPGLVDRFDPGAHRDMDINTFVRSAEAISPYFTRMYLSGYSSFQTDPDQPLQNVFSRARHIGVEAEKAMYKATGGVNTHKGAIFTLGLLNTACGYVSAESAAVVSADECRTFQMYERVLDCASGMVSGIVHTELAAPNLSDRPGSPFKDRVCRQSIKRDDYDHGLKNRKDMQQTAGESLYASSGMTGIRGEAEAGFPSIRKYGIPVLRKTYRDELSLDEQGVHTLLHLMTVVEDTTVAARGGIDALSNVRCSAEKALGLGGVYSAAGRKYIKQMNREFIRRNYSPGGCADLLAASLFLCTYAP